ncbi:hypothetical protein GCM10009551_053850 [Nocardiopsis tropica]|uniref:hypothetical protein n=1 Tax=Tsukamurella strandjordii TaxID=147577 RepID=UPI0031E051AC
MIKQVQVLAVRRHAEAAIWERGCPPAEGILSVTRDEATSPRTVVLHVSSGHNAIVSRRALERHGYTVEDTGYDSFAPGNLGVKLRVGPTAVK